MEKDTAVSEKCSISRIAYELYKQDWIDEHTSKQMRLDALRAYHVYVRECLENDFEVDSFEDWISEAGYGNGCLYVCYEEFCNTEYHDTDYMEDLLQSPADIKLYYEDIKDVRDPYVYG